jgi:hypothetical protein
MHTIVGSGGRRSVDNEAMSVNDVTADTNRREGRKRNRVEDRNAADKIEA